VFYRRAVEMDPTHAWNLASLARLLAYARDDHAAAHLLFLRAVRADPGDVSVVETYVDFLTAIRSPAPRPSAPRAPSQRPPRCPRGGRRSHGGAERGARGAGRRTRTLTATSGTRWRTCPSARNYCMHTATSSARCSATPPRPTASSSAPTTPLSPSDAAAPAAGTRHPKPPQQSVHMIRELASALPCLRQARRDAVCARACELDFQFSLPHSHSPSPSRMPSLRALRLTQPGEP
jgi:hypothetical protein